MRKKQMVLLLAVTLLLGVVAVPAASAADAPVTYIGPGGMELSTPFEATHWDDVWDLTKGDLVLSYTIDMNNVLQPGTWDTYNRTTLYAEVGLRGEGALDFNPGWAWDTYQGSCGGWMVSDDDTWNDSDGYTERGNPDPSSTQDLDDTHGLAASGARGSRDYDVLLSNPDVVGPTRPDPWDPTKVIGAYGSHDNYGLWFDRDGVDPWQDDDPLTPAPGGSAVPWGSHNGQTYNTGGWYDIVITYHAIDANGNGDKTDDGLGVMFATVNGIPQGFYYPSWHEGAPDYYPAGLSFKGDMEHMQVFAGVWGPNSEQWAVAQYGGYFDYGSVTLYNLVVEQGVPGISDPLVADFSYSPDPVLKGDTVQFTDATDGGMAPYTYLWNFGDGTTSTEQNPSHTYATAGDYTVSLTVTPFRCMPRKVTKTITVHDWGEITVRKFYDANANGVWDPGEVEVPGWMFTIGDAEYFTPATLKLPLGDYTVTEGESCVGCWTSTTPTSVDVTVVPGGQMYADAYTTGTALPVNLDPYAGPNHPLRLNPANALGPFDAVQPASQNDRFFGVGARDWTNYTFANDFMNVDGVPDIEFAEVTWGSWHTEAALVYLTDAYVRDAGDNVVPYGATDDGIGYYAGIVWNKIGILGLTDGAREAIAETYLPSGVTRTFVGNEFAQNGNFGVSQFHLPAEVVSATGITLVDITADVYDAVSGYIGPYAYPSGDLLGQPGTFTNVSAAGGLVTVTGLDPFAFVVGPGIGGNTDGYDLDAIRVYRYESVGFGNLCLGAGGGYTLGFWSNKNGQALIGSDDRAMLRLLNLRTGTGGNFDPTTNAQVKSWLLSANATNMAYMLSAQLAAMELNVFNGKVDGAALIYAPGTTSANALGFATVNAVMAEANAALLSDGLTPDGDPNRMIQEALKNALDRANNNRNFVQAEPCAFSFSCG